ncbi:MAG: hypothetical protein V4474_01545 [Patescibacteria group bacterium]
MRKMFIGGLCVAGLAVGVGVGSAAALVALAINPARLTMQPMPGSVEIAYQVKNGTFIPSLIAAAPVVLPTDVNRLAKSNKLVGIKSAKDCDECGKADHVPAPTALEQVRNLTREYNK